MTTPSRTDLIRKFRWAFAPAAILAIAAGALLLRREPEPVVRRERAAAPVPGGELPAVAPAATLPPLAPANEVAHAVENDRILSTYRNYRAAVATKNTALQKALQPILLRDRDAAIRIARQDVDRSTDPQDREISRQTLEALRR
jgi:hypothetical protein